MTANDYKKATQRLINFTYVLKSIKENKNRKWDIQTKLIYTGKMLKILNTI